MTIKHKWRPALAGLLLLLGADAFAQGLGGPAPWTIGTVNVPFRRTSNNPNGYSGQPSDGKLRNASGTVVGSYRDSLWIIRANTANQMQFDTSGTFSIADMPDWIATRSNPSTAATVANDSLWAFSVNFYPVNDGLTATLGAGTTGGGATITADTVSYYQECSFDGGVTWVRARAGNGITSIVELGTSNAFYWACNSLAPTFEGTFDTPSIFFPIVQNRFVFIHDCSGQYGVKILYPKGIR